MGVKPKKRRKPAILREAMSQKTFISDAKSHRNRPKPVRTSVTLTSVQAEFLRFHAARLEISVADLIRRIVDGFRAAPG